MRIQNEVPKILSSDNRGSSAIEFALIFPVLLVLMLAGTQLVLYINATRRVELVTTSISEMISQAMPPANSTTGKVNSLDLHFAYDASLVLFPYLMKDAARQGIYWWQDITVDFAGIQFQGNGANCGNNPDQSTCYVASVGWTSTGTVGSNYRPCTIPQLPVDNTIAPNRYTLPRSLYGPGSIIAVDVAFTFTPTFGSRFLPALQIRRSIFVQPRYATYITFDTTNSDGIATLCPGFS
jgi:Flp pilus assembly protein TadG